MALPKRRIDTFAFFLHFFCRPRQWDVTLTVQIVLSMNENLKRDSSPCAALFTEVLKHKEEFRMYWATLVQSITNSYFSSSRYRIGYLLLQWFSCINFIHGLNSIFVSTDWLTQFIIIQYVNNMSSGMQKYNSFFCLCLMCSFSRLFYFFPLNCIQNHCSFILLFHRL